MIQVIKPQIGERIYDGACGSAGFLCEAHEYLRHGEKGGKMIDAVNELGEVENIREVFVGFQRDLY